MFPVNYWAQAFINIVKEEELDDGIETLKVLASWIKTLPGEIYGRTAAEKLQPLIRNGFLKTGEITAVRESTIRFFILLVKKRYARHINSIIDAIKKLADKMRGLVSVSLEYAKPVELDSLNPFLNSIEAEIKKSTGASRVEIIKRCNPEIIGGYKLRIEDKIIDASIQLQLEKLRESLAGGN